MNDIDNNTFSQVPEAAPDPILGLTEAFRNDSFPKKVNLGVGVYQNEHGRVPILQSVKKAEQLWLEKEITKTYLPIEGEPLFTAEVEKFLFGQNSPLISEKRIATMQTVGGSGGLSIGIRFLNAFFPQSTVFISDPSWENHRMLFEYSGAKVDTYPYYNPKTHSLDFNAMMDKLNSLPKGSIVLLHGCCHNPTGVDIGKDQWPEIIASCKSNRLIPFIDIAYQGFAEGIEKDALSVRLFAESGLSFLVATSYAKSMSLYRERVGSVVAVTRSSDETKNVRSQLKRIVRRIYSSPPSHGAQIAALILSDPGLRQEWEAEVKIMRERIVKMREKMCAELARYLPNADFSFILKQRGMFSYSGLPKEVMCRLREEFHIYALDSGRICMAALNDQNMQYVCSSIATCLKS